MNDDQTNETPDVETPNSNITPLSSGLQPQPTVSAHGKSKKKIWWALGLIILIGVVAAAFWYLGQHSVKNNKTQVTAVTHATAASTSAAKVPGLQLDTNKNYGNKYANGLLPVGDGKYSTSGAKKGYVYACSTYAQNLSLGQGGASTRGPWFTANNTEYDINKKVHVAGSVPWKSSFTDSLNGSSRVITTNDLPNHPSGVFPIAASDPAYAYDRNPNSIQSQSLTYTLSASPNYGAPSCMGGEAGIMLTGVALFNAFDAGGRDAGAWEVQDSCSGHPQKNGEYHYHTLSSCITDTSVSTVIGFALDGFPITGPKLAANNILTTDDLDECHGIVSEVNLNGKKVTTYHYVMTQDFPYSVSCFRAKAVQTAPADGQQTSQQQAAPTQQPTGPGRMAGTPPPVRPPQ